MVLRGLLVGFHLFLLLGYPTVFAEDEGPEDETKTAVEESLLVTARKREENIREVPLSMVSFNKTRIADLGLERLEDVVSQVPNVSLRVAQSTENITMTVRGISQVRNGDAPLAVVVDGITLPEAYFINADLLDVKRIEVLKGPQGALFGRNAIGGALSIVTSQPTYEREQLVKLDIGNGGDEQIMFSSSGALFSSHKLFYRVAGSWTDLDGHIDNTFLGSKVDHHEEKNASLKLKAFLGDWSLDLWAVHGELEAGAFYYVRLPDGRASDVSLNPSSDIPGFSTRDTFLGALKLQREWDWGRFVAISSYSDLEHALEGDGDFRSISFLRSEADFEVQSTSQEFRFTSHDNQRLRWVAGIYFQDSERNLRQVFGSADFTLIFADNRSVIESQTTAVFTQFDYDFSERVEASLSLRYDLDERTQLSGQRLSDDYDALQPKLSLSWKPRDGFMVFTSYGRGFRSGGFNAPSEVFDERYEKELSDSLEVGLKSSFLNDRVLVDGAIFTTDFQDQQSFLFDSDSNSQGIYNVESTRIHGAELSFFTKAREGFSFDVALGTTDADIDRMDMNKPFLASFQGENFTGNHSPYVHRNTANLGVNLQKTIRQLSFYVRSEYEHRGKLYWHLDNRDFQPSVDMFDIRMSLKGKSWRLELYGENLTDEAYNAEFSSMEFLGGETDIRYPAGYRSYGVKVEKRF